MDFARRWSDPLSIRHTNHAHFIVKTAVRTELHKAVLLLLSFINQTSKHHSRHRLSIPHVRLAKR